MATVILDLTKSWLDLTTDQSFVLNGKYSIQNLGTTAVYLNEKSFQPATKEEGNILNSHESAILIQEADTIYVRCASDDGRVVINTIT